MFHWFKKYTTLTGQPSVASDKTVINKDFTEQAGNIQSRREQEKNKAHICKHCGNEITGWSGDDMQNCYISCMCSNCNNWNHYRYW